MDLSRIFMKGACPTSIGGQAVMEGVMMRGEDRTAVAVRVPDGRIYLRTKKNGPRRKITKVPLIRGVVSFVQSLAQGMQILTFSADVLENFEETLQEGEEEEPSRFEAWMTRHFGEKAVWNFMVFLSVLVAIVVTVAVFILFPTFVVGALDGVVKNQVALNLLEGLLRIALFILYVAAIARMPEIRRVFEYHGAEHKTIHCFENGLDLTPDNAEQFYTLHPRCGTSFLMFVMVVSLVLFSLLGWPNLAVRVLSRIALMPVVAGLSYELLRWAGRSNSRIIEILSMPGILLQKLTTREPDKDQLQVAICSLKAVLVPAGTPPVEGFCDENAAIVEPYSLERSAEDREGTDEVPLDAEDAATTAEGAAPAAGVKTYRELLQGAEERLRSAGIECPDVDARILLENASGLSRTDLFLNADRPAGAETENRFEELIGRRASRIPLQHLTGVQSFMGLDFSVNGTVLVPRPETEVLVEEALRQMKEDGKARPDGSPLRVLDAGTGSGAIAVSVAALSEIPCVITASDVQEEALETARKNAERILPAEKSGEIRFVRGDLFKPFLADGETFDYVLSNPPYIPTEDIASLAPEVRDHDPRAALDGGSDGLAFYRRLADEGRRVTAPGGRMIVEIGFDQREAVTKLLEEAGWTLVRCLRDLSGLDRVVTAERPR